MTVIIVLSAIVLCIALWFIAAYNNLIRLNQLLKEGWSGIDVQLKRRYDLVPNLVAVVKQYAAHERGVFEAVTVARTTSINAPTIAQRSLAEMELTKTITNLLAVAENYPALKANRNFLSLQGELSSLESEIQLGRRYYNGTARNYNIATQSFPSIIVARSTGFQNADFFQLSADERETPQVKL